MRRAEIQMLGGAVVKCYAIRHHPAASYGQAVWVDEQGIPVANASLPIDSPLYKVVREWDEDIIDQVRTCGLTYNELSRRARIARGVLTGGISGDTRLSTLEAISKALDRPLVLYDTPLGDVDVDIPTALRLQLAQLDLSQKDVADATGLSPNIVSNAMRGKTDTALKTLQAIAKAMHTEVILKM